MESDSVNEFAGNVSVGGAQLDSPPYHKSHQHLINIDINDQPVGMIAE